MTTTLSDEIRQALEKEGCGPVHLVDEGTNAHYVIMRADQYDKIRTLFSEGESSPSALYPLVTESFLREGWDDPEMDVYDDYQVDACLKVALGLP